MSKSTQVANADVVQGALHTALKPRGFRKKGRTFNRVTDDGLTQVINLQMGSYDPPGTVHVPGLRENLYGRFTVNLGVYVPEVARMHGGGEAKGVVQEYQCCVRERLGSLAEKRDVWWLVDAPATVIPDVLARLERDGLPFLERFRSRDSILRELEDPRNETVAVPHRIVRAIILVERGATAAARDLLAVQALETGNPGHPAYVRSLAERLGIPLE